VGLFSKGLDLLRREESLSPARMRTPDRPALFIVTILTELSRLLLGTDIAIVNRCHISSSIRVLEDNLDGGQT
jgi:hypothetical protein